MIKTRSSKHYKCIVLKVSSLQKIFSSDMIFHMLESTLSQESMNRHAVDRSAPQEDLKGTKIEPLKRRKHRQNKQS